MEGEVHLRTTKCAASQGQEAPGRLLTEKQHARLLKLLKSGQSQTEVAEAC